MKYTVSFLTAAFLTLFSMTAGAQALPFVAGEYNATSLGKAGADLVDTENTAFTALSNSAALGFTESKADVEAGITSWAPSGTIAVAGGSYVLGKLGVAAGLVQGTHAAYDITNEGGSVVGSFKPTDTQISAGVSYKVLPILSIGANIGYATSKLSDKYSYGAVKADVMAMAKFGDLKAAFGVKDLGTAVTSASGAKFSLPTHVALGAGYGMTFAEKHNVDALLDVDYYFNGGVAVAAGVEYCMDNFVFVRGGYRYGGNSPIPSFASLGAGVKFKEFKVNFAYVLGSETMANTLSICLGYTL